jgi:hypothetical protein
VNKINNFQNLSQISIFYRLRTITESGIYERQYSRIVLYQQFIGVKKEAEFLKSKEVEDENQVKLEIIRDLFIALPICYSISAGVLILEILYLKMKALKVFSGSKKARKSLNKSINLK